MVEENLNAGETIWKWSSVKPTELRLNQQYSQVKTDKSTNLINTNSPNSDFHCCLCVSQSFPLPVPDRPDLPDISSNM